MIVIYTPTRKVIKNLNISMKVDDFFNVGILLKSRLKL